MTKTDRLDLDNHQLGELARIASVLYQALEPPLNEWMEHHRVPKEPPYVTASLLSVLDAFAFMIIVENINPSQRLLAAREHCTALRKTLRAYHQDTGN